MTAYESEEYLELVRLEDEFEDMCNEYDTVGDLIEVCKLYNSLSIIF